MDDELRDTLRRAVERLRLRAGLMEGASALYLGWVADAFEEAMRDPEESQSAPEEHWIGPFTWAGGECPVPPETMVKVTYAGRPESRIWTAESRRWSHIGAPGDIIEFSYRADNAGGWIPLPPGFLCQGAVPGVFSEFDTHRSRMRLTPVASKPPRPELPEGAAINEFDNMNIESTHQAICGSHSADQLRAVAKACEAWAKLKEWEEEWGDD